MDRKRILMIATGGTIATVETAEGLSPMLTSHDLLLAVPELNGICDIETLQLFNLDSTNINCKHWLDVAKCIRANYALYDGFVITHGTDTMAYTASALSYLVQKSKKPIVITGAQQSISKRETDARRNLICAFRYAADKRANGVHIVFDGQVILGTRARKIRSKSYNAFDSIDYPVTSIVLEDKVIHYIEETDVTDQPLFFDRMAPHVFVWKLIPGPDASIFPYLIDNYDAVVIESFGVGGIPCHEDSTFIDGIAELIAHGKTVVMTTQVPHEGSDLGRYQVGYRIKEEYEALEAYNMTLESVVTKLMWILGQTNDPKKIRELFNTPVAHDLIM